MSQAETPSPAPALQRIMACMQKEDYAAAESILHETLKEFPDDATLLHLMGMTRLQQNDPDGAEPYFKRSIELLPGQALMRLNYGKLQARMGRDEDAAISFREAARLKPELTEAHLEMGNALQRLGRPHEAEAPLRTAMRQAPDQAQVKLALGNVLLDTSRFKDAAAVTIDGLAQATDSVLRAGLYKNLGLAQRRLRKDAAALENFENAQQLAPGIFNLDAMRAALLQNLNRNDEALAALAAALERDPQDLESHYNYNSLLYRLGHADKFLKSFDKAARSRDILMVKANLARKVERNQEAHDLYAELLTENGNDPEVLAAMAGVLAKLDRPQEGLCAMEKALKLKPGHPYYLGHMAAMLIRLGDGAAAAKTAQQAMDLEPLNQSNIALLSTAWRLMGDARDEELAGYDDLIRTFELEAPTGWNDMASFNAELLAELEKIHPNTREHLDQSLRFGTQTPGALFGAGHRLVEALRGRFSEAVARYIDELPRGHEHIYVRRRTGNFQFSGSWSSRLKDCGYHTNHIHPGGWISSCYYVALPETIKVENEKQGWIKFGQPLMRPDMLVRRAIQPVEGRLILFPSYMWHGTIPFRSQTARTTIAFDILPS